MIADLKPYRAMKDSGVEWLGEVPDHWEVRRLKYLLRERDTRSTDGSEQLLRVSQYTGVTERRSKSGTDEPDTRAASLIGYKTVDSGELVVNIMLAWNRSMGVSTFPGICSPAYCVYQFNDCAMPWYFHNLLRSSSYKARIKALSTGVVESRLRLYTDNLYRLEGVLPPLPEQDAIVRFIEYIDRRIRRYIRAKQKLIKLLEEQKQAIIHQAVTGQIDVRTGNPYPTYKPSGVEWLGDVPEHWKVLRTKHVFREVDTRSTTGEETHLSMSQKLGLVPSDMVQSTLKSESYIGGKLCEAEDLVLNRLKAHLGVFALAKQAGVISPDYSVFRKKRPISTTYFELVLRSPACRRELRIRAKGIVEGFWRLYTDDFYDIRVPVPPVPEQDLIIAELDQATTDIDTAIARANREIELLGEYRTRLIADVVTGKLDVRDAAASLSDESDDLEEEDGFDDTLTDETQVEIDEVVARVDDDA